MQDKTPESKLSVAVPASHIPDWFQAMAPLTFTSDALIDVLTPGTRQLALVSYGYVGEQTEDRFNGLVTHAIYGPGDLVISSRLQTSKDNPRIYKALTKCQLKIASDDHLLLDTAAKAELDEFLLKNSMRQLQYAYERLENLMLKYAEDRIIFRLLFYARRFGVKKGNSVLIELPLTHRLLASTLNLSRERVSRTMHRLAKEGLLSYPGQRVMIKNLVLLEQKITFMPRGTTPDRGA